MKNNNSGFESRRNVTILIFFQYFHQQSTIRHKSPYWSFNDISELRFKVAWWRPPFDYEDRTWTMARVVHHMHEAVYQIEFDCRIKLNTYVCKFAMLGFLHLFCARSSCFLSRYILFNHTIRCFAVLLGSVCFSFEMLEELTLNCESIKTELWGKCRAGYYLFTMTFYWVAWGVG